MSFAMVQSYYIHCQCVCSAPSVLHIHSIDSSVAFFFNLFENCIECENRNEKLFAISTVLLLALRGFEENFSWIVRLGHEIVFWLFTSTAWAQKKAHTQFQPCLFDVKCSAQTKFCRFFFVLSIEFALYVWGCNAMKIIAMDVEKKGKKLVSPMSYHDFKVKCFSVLFFLFDSWASIHLHTYAGTDTCSIHVHSFAKIIR